MLRKSSPEEIAADKAAISRLLRAYRLLFGVPAILALLAAVYFFGYALGYFDGWNQRPTQFERNQ